MGKKDGTDGRQTDKLGKYQQMDWKQTYIILQCNTQHSDNALGDFLNYSYIILASYSSLYKPTHDL